MYLYVDVDIYYKIVRHITNQTHGYKSWSSLPQIVTYFEKQSVKKIRIESVFLRKIDGKEIIYNLLISGHIRTKKVVRPRLSIP